MSDQPNKINQGEPDGFFYDGVIQSTNYPDSLQAEKYPLAIIGAIRKLPLNIPVTFSLLSDGSTLPDAPETNLLTIKTDGGDLYWETFSPATTSPFSLTPGKDGILISLYPSNGTYSSFLIKFEGRQTWFKMRNLKCF